MVIDVRDIIKEEIARLEEEGDEFCQYKEKGIIFRGSRLTMLKKKLKRMY